MLDMFNIQGQRVGGGGGGGGVGVGGEGGCGQKYLLTILLHTFFPII